MLTVVLYFIEIIFLRKNIFSYLGKTINETMYRHLQLNARCEVEKHKQTEVLKITSRIPPTPHVKNKKIF